MKFSVTTLNVSVSETELWDASKEEETDTRFLLVLAD